MIPTSGQELSRAIKIYRELYGKGELDITKLEEIIINERNKGNK